MPSSPLFQDSDHFERNFLKRDCFADRIALRKELGSARRAEHDHARKIAFFLRKKESSGSDADILYFYHFRRHTLKTRFERIPR
jgi:hypothetical protein